MGEVERPRLPGTYWRLWWAYSIDTVGDGVFAAAVPLLAVRLTQQPVLVSSVSAATFLPWLLFSLPAGALVDRYNRLSLMWYPQLVQAAVVVITTLLIASHHASIAVLVVMSFLLGICEVISGNAGQALLPEIVPASLLHRANGYFNSAATIGQSFVGPPIGSLLFTVAVTLPFGINAFSFVVSGVLIASIPRTSAATPSADHPPVGPLPALVTSLAATVVIYEGIGLAPDAGVLAALLALNGFAMTIWNILTVSLRQQAVPDELRGRVNSVYRMIGWGPIPLGALAGGVVAATLGLRTPYLVAGGIRAIALAAALPALAVALRMGQGDDGGLADAD